MFTQNITSEYSSLQDKVVQTVPVPKKKKKRKSNNLKTATTYDKIWEHKCWQEHGHNPQ